MLVLGIESSCDECAAAVVEDGRRVLSTVVASQVAFHEKYRGVVPELASRMHVEWIAPTVAEALEKAGLRTEGLDGIAVTVKPGLTGSLLVGLQFAKGLAWSLGKPWVGVNHILAHLYAPRLEAAIDYPFLGLLVSGGHTIICRVEGFDDIRVMGTTVDDAAGEAFDKVSAHYGFGYPGGAAIDALAARGDPEAFAFPDCKLAKGDHRYDVSYSGLKNAAINQLERFRRRPPGTGRPADERADIAASFQRAAVDILVARLLRAADDTGLRTIVAGGGVAANSRLRARLAERSDVRAIFPPLWLCGDNGAMVAALGYELLKRGDRSEFSLSPSSRVPLYKKTRS
jgi:N6-L-threonylcarbamoyladenine synthase